MDTGHAGFVLHGILGGTRGALEDTSPPATHRNWMCPKSLAHTEAPPLSWYQSNATVIPCYNRDSEWREQNENLYTPSTEIDKQKITVLVLIECLNYT